MISIVIVSHSDKLAQGVAELARGMAGSDVRIAATGGLAIPDHPLGTDAALVLAAIQEVYSDEGVLVLVDLGSAVLSTEMALEQLAPEQRSHVILSDAPLVEGAIAAAVQARVGGTLEQALHEARQALHVKVAEVGDPEEVKISAPVTSPSVQVDSSTSEMILVVSNPHGLHARPAAEFVKTAARFMSDITVENLSERRGPVNAKSITAVLILGVSQGHRIRLSAKGEDAGEALAAIRSLMESG